MSEPDKQLKLAEQVVEKLKKLGAQQGMAVLRHASSVEVQVRDAKLEKLQQSTSAGLTVHVYADGRYAAHTTSDLRPSELDSFLKDAVQLTRLLDADPLRSLPDAALVLSKPNELKLFDADHPRLDSSRRRQMAQAAADAARSDPRVISVTAGFSDEDGLVAAAASNGLRAWQRDTVYSLSAEVTGKDGDKRPEDWWYTAGRKLGDLGQAGDVGKEAMTRALLRVGSKTLPSGPRTLVLENRAAGQLLRYFLQAAQGMALQQKRSFLDGKIGQQVMTKLLNLNDDPGLAGALGSRSFDRDGMSAKPFAVVEGGLLRNYFLDWYYAKKLGLAPTTGGWSNLVVAPGKDSLQALIAKAGNGLFVTSLIGGNSNSLTGDFSVGLQGLEIVNGKPAGAVGEVNLTGNHKDFWTKVQVLGDDPYRYGSMRAPSLLIEGAAVSGS
jgi:PmbA protein